MEILFKKINQKINGLIWSLFSTGILLLLMAILTIWSDLFMRLIFGLITLVISYIFIYAALKLRTLKNDIKNHFKF